MEEPVRILMVEDMLVDANLAEREIRKVLASCVFQRVDTRQAFIEAISNFQPDLVITDYRMPRFDGMQALKLSIELAPFTPVIVLTGAINEDTAVECMKAGAADYVIKEHIKRLGQAVIHALDDKKIACERSKAEEVLREREELYRTLVETLPDSVTVTDTQGNITYNSAEARRFHGMPPASPAIGTTIFDWLSGESIDKGKETWQSLVANGYIWNAEVMLYKPDKTPYYAEINASSLRDAQGTVIGYVINVHDVSERKRAELAIRESEALYRKRTAELETLFTLSTLLRQAQNASDVLQIAVNEVKRFIEVDSVVIALLDRKRENFCIEHAAGGMVPEIGLTFSAQQESIPKQVVKSRQPYVTADYTSDPNRVKGALMEISADRLPLACVPIQSEDEILGILAVARRCSDQGQDFGLSEVRLLSTIGDMTGNYLSRVRLYEDLQRSNNLISAAYEDTIDALSRALDLRDRDTEGHTNRVIALALALARKLGMDHDQIVQVRRGAYLHDMGKIGIPDLILLKPSALTSEEWDIMRKHPQYTYDMLSHIEYLLPALDIPYCHHEKWDGTGYPRGLKGEQIPLAARLFAIVDVWDALTNERPYRHAWSQEKALQYIREQSGKHFDPAIVEIFLEIIQAQLK